MSVTLVKLARCRVKMGTVILNYHAGRQYQEIIRRSRVLTADEIGIFTNLLEGWQPEKVMRKIKDSEQRNGGE